MSCNHLPCLLDTIAASTGHVINCPLNTSINHFLQMMVAELFKIPYNRCDRQSTFIVCHLKHLVVKLILSWNRRIGTHWMTQYDLLYRSFSTKFLMRSPPRGADEVVFNFINHFVFWNFGGVQLSWATTFIILNRSCRFITYMWFFWLGYISKSWLLIIRIMLDRPKTSPLIMKDK